MPTHMAPDLYPSEIQIFYNNNPFSKNIFF